MAPEPTLNTLQTLLEASQEAARDFLLCARHTASDELRRRFMARAIRCNEEACELQRHLITQGGTHHVSSGARNAWHRGWLRITGVLFGRNDRAWLEACSRAEIQLLSRYKKSLLDNTLPAPLRRLAERQFFAWQHLHSQIKGLRQLARATL